MMAGRHGGEPEGLGPGQEAVELEVTIAFDAWVGREPECVGIDVGLHHVGVEVLAEVEHVVLDTQLVGHPTGVVDVGNRAATGVALAAPQLHRYAGDPMPGIEEERGGHRRVHAARHGDENIKGRGFPGNGSGSHQIPNERSRSMALGTTASA
jgi:hypothetical protein